MIVNAFLLVPSLVLWLTVAASAGDVSKGQQVFGRCATCHSLAAGENGIGPSLHGIIGRKAGTATDYSFSKAMTASGIIWDATSLKKFLSDPEATVPGTKMQTGAIDNPQAIDDLIAYLKQAAR